MGEGATPRLCLVAGPLAGVSLSQPLGARVPPQTETENQQKIRTVLWKEDWMKPRELTVEFKRAAIARMVPGVKISALARELGAADDFASVHVSVRPGAAVSRTPSDGSAHAPSRSRASSPGKTYSLNRAVFIWARGARSPGHPCAAWFSLA